MLAEQGEARTLLILLCTESLMRMQIFNFVNVAMPCAAIVAQFVLS